MRQRVSNLTPQDKQDILAYIQQKVFEPNSSAIQREQLQNIRACIMFVDLFHRTRTDEVDEASRNEIAASLPR